MIKSELYKEIVATADSEQAKILTRFFKTDKGDYGEGDVFLGVKVPTTRSIVKKYWKNADFEDLEECISSEFHEVRLAALLTLVQIFKHAKNDYQLQKQCIDFYLSHLKCVNNWDLVDLSCYELLGAWLLDKDREIIYDLANNGTTIWEQRIGIVSTMQFLRHNELDDTYKIAEIILNGKMPVHDLLQKAVGWLLREAGKRDDSRLKLWLYTHLSTLPRTTLRYAIEKFPASERKQFLKK